MTIVQGQRDRIYIVFDGTISPGSVAAVSSDATIISVGSPYLVILNQLVYVVIASAVAPGSATVTITATGVESISKSVDYVVTAAPSTSPTATNNGTTVATSTPY